MPSPGVATILTVSHLIPSYTHILFSCVYLAFSINAHIPITPNQITTAFPTFKLLSLPIKISTPIDMPYF